MTSRRRFDNRDIRRRGPRLEPKRRILVVCEGRETERQYLKDFQHAQRNPRVHVEVAKETGVPLTVVQEAVRLGDEADALAKREHDDNLKWDEVWGVFDVDEHPNVPQARQLAKAKGIKLAVSNPCFELWALLHFQDQRAHIERDKAAAALKMHMPGYEKTLNFDGMSPTYQEAVRRALALVTEAERHEDSDRNPTTRVYLLTESIRAR